MSPQASIVGVALVATVLERELLSNYIDVPVLVVTVLGTALAFFIGFLNNQAYDRWWEARKIWGAFVNDSRNFAHMVKAYVAVPEGSEAESDVARLQTRFVERHVAFLKATVVRLRGLDDRGYEKHLTPSELSELSGYEHKPNGIAFMQRRDLDHAEKLGYVDGFRMLAINRMLDNFFDDIGKAERIKSTVFPLGHVYLTRMSVWLFVILLPMALADSVGYWAIFFTWILGTLYVFTFAAGQAIVNPFENKPSDTPMSAITRTIEMNMRDVLEEKHDLLALPTVDGTHWM